MAIFSILLLLIFNRTAGGFKPHKGRHRVEFFIDSAQINTLFFVSEVYILESNNGFFFQQLLFVTGIAVPFAEFAIMLNSP
ncbi:MULTISPECIES: hypothetical protein [Rahnella]|jgi:hypothetical protein|uniref:Uncharacterized protein n=1 Tax=Rahnella sp. (strain Y9602) TaxID=2703885 RepID=A0ABW6CEB0_RAHSY|nr:MULTISPECIES: hypothetical protein [Rahnella]AFE57383.1 hypothetical protein Q7S_05665 [Rahnella aquatilis HX2]AZP41377.1 hypothetical protein EJP79_05795 [Rahnella aquatilis]MQB52187.1 hypothetical protein [Rahnella sp. RcJ3]MBU9838868.1 hypothetical protein [Rahnella aceris]MBU9862109.1 hypothetical protein [Rahnella aceris]